MSQASVNVGGLRNKFRAPALVPALTDTIPEWLEQQLPQIKMVLRDKEHLT